MHLAGDIAIVSAPKTFVLVLCTLQRDDVRAAEFNCMTQDHSHRCAKPCEDKKTYIYIYIYIVIYTYIQEDLVTDEFS